MKGHGDKLGEYKLDTKWLLKEAKIIIRKIVMAESQSEEKPDVPTAEERLVSYLAKTYFEDIYARVDTCLSKESFTISECP